jgi:hypothetical protein
MLRWLSLTVLIALPALGQERASPGLDDLMHARNFGMGGAYRSLGYGAEAVGGNPAAIALFKRYQVEASGAWDPTNNFLFGEVAVADSASSELATGLSYHIITMGDGETRRTVHVNTLALAVAFGSVFAIGLSGRNHIITGYNETNSITMNAGIVVRPWEFLSLSVSGHNLIDNFNPDIQRYFTFAASGLIAGVFSPAFELKGDFNLPVARFSVGTGAEYILADNFPIRAGYSYDGPRDVHAISFGLGFFLEGSGIDLAYRHEINGPGRMLALTIKYHTSGM